MRSWRWNIGCVWKDWGTTCARIPIVIGLLYKYIHESTGTYMYIYNTIPRGYCIFTPHCVDSNRGSSAGGISALDVTVNLTSKSLA